MLVASNEASLQEAIHVITFAGVHADYAVADVGDIVSVRAAAAQVRLSYRSANRLVAHRPLGQIMRARLFTYARIADWRRAHNGAPHARPDFDPVPAQGQPA